MEGFFDFLIVNTISISATIVLILCYIKHQLYLVSDWMEKYVNMQQSVISEVQPPTHTKFRIIPNNLMLVTYIVSMYTTDVNDKYLVKFYYRKTNETSINISVCTFYHDKSSDTYTCFYYDVKNMSISSKKCCIPSKLNIAYILVGKYMKTH